MMKKLIAILVLGVAFSANAQEKVNLTVSLKGISGDEGQLLISLFNNSHDFLSHPYKKMKVDINKAGSDTLAFKGLPVGEYAVAVILDTNSNGQLDFGNMGPIEKYGFSNNPSSLYGPPNYSSAKMLITRDSTITIKLN